MQKNNLAIILSGGHGSRFDSKTPKQFFYINDKTIIENSVQKFLNINLFKKIIIVSHKDFITKTRNIFTSPNIEVIEGGATRQASVYKGLEKANEFNPENILIHDSVRPFFTEKLIKEILDRLSESDGVIPALNIHDSVRFFKEDRYEDIERNNLKLIQTPQGFKFNSIKNAHNENKEEKFTDDSIIFFKYKKNINIIEGERFNFKITTKGDYKLGKILFERVTMNNIRIGSGFDVHKFKNGKSLRIFGIDIPFGKSLEGHSDADVGFHSIVDAILGALCKGDIGNHFPPDDMQWKNKESVFFMEYTKKLLLEENYRINNLDITLICEKPKVSQFKKEFTKSISKALDIEENIINVKGTTTEKLGFLGREEGIACQVSVILASYEN